MTAPAVTTPPGPRWWQMWKKKHRRAHVFGSSIASFNMGQKGGGGGEETPPPPTPKIRKNVASETTLCRWGKYLRATIRTQECHLGRPKRAAFIW